VFRAGPPLTYLGPNSPCRLIFSPEPLYFAPRPPPPPPVFLCTSVFCFFSMKRGQSPQQSPRSHGNSTLPTLSFLYRTLWNGGGSCVYVYPLPPVPHEPPPSPNPPGRNFTTYPSPPVPTSCIDGPFILLGSAPYLSIF